MRPKVLALVLMTAGAGFLAACDNGKTSMANAEKPPACEETAASLSHWIGKSYEELKPLLDPARLPGVEKLRTYSRGSMLTMDYVPNRLNVEYDKDGKVTRIHCG